MSVRLCARAVGMRLGLRRFHVFARFVFFYTFRSLRLRSQRLVNAFAMLAASLLLHSLQLFGSELRQAPDERNQRPDRFRAVGASPGGHPREANAVGDDVEQLAIRQSLRLLVGHVRNFWVEIST